jgi:DNA transposition AAA+ family ATPase
MEQAGGDGRDPDAPDPRSREAMPERSLNRIPGYRVFDATKNLPEEQMLAVRWLHGHYWDSGKSLGETGRLIGYDGGNISKIFHGKYEGDMRAVEKAIARYRKLAEERASVNRAPFIETRLYRDIEECCQAALTYQKIVHIYGESQVGKTSALRHYEQKHNHGETIMVTVPVGGSLIAFCTAMAERLRMNPAQKLVLMQANIMRSITARNLVIIDEAHRLFQAQSYSGQTMRTVDFIRDLQEETGCGIVLCGTNVFREQMQDRAREKFLNQFRRRCLLRRQLPDVPQREDLNAFAAHYGLAPAGGDALALQTEVVRDHGLGVWLTMLTAAARNATRQNKDMAWDHVLRAHAFFQRMEMPRLEG